MASVTLAVSLVAASTVVVAQTAPPSEADPDAPLASFSINGETRGITRAAQIDADALARSYLLAADCPAACIAPQIAAPGVATLGEAEVMAFLETAVGSGQGVLLDARAIGARPDGQIPGSVSLPLALFAPNLPHQRRLLEALGAGYTSGGYDFAAALPVVVYDAGPLTDDAALLIAALLEVGYPAEQIQYYRGGLHVWRALGLSVEGAGDE